MPKQLPPDATIGTVWPHLVYQRQYVADVLQMMRPCVKAHGNANVRIGVTGSGQKPCYRISYKTGEGEAIYGSYWDTGNPLDREDAQNNNWSTASMDFAELEAFFKEKIHWKGKA